MRKFAFIAVTMFAISLLCYSFDYKNSFKQGEDIFYNSENQVNAIPFFERIVQSYELGELTNDAYHYYMKSLEYLCLLYLKNGQNDMSRQMLEKIIKTDPSHVLNKEIFPRKIRKLYAELKKNMVGHLDVKCSVSDFKCLVDGKERKKDETGKIPVLAGKHTVEVLKENYSNVKTEIEVKAGEVVEIDAPIIRIKASATILTQPQGVKVYLDGVYVGETSGTAPLDYLKEHPDTIQELGIVPSMLSDYFVINNLEKGEHTVELKKECYKTEKIILTIDELKDYFYKPFILERSIGYLTVQSGVFGLEGDVFIDERRIGSLPVKKLEVCSGSHQIKVAFPSGFFIKNVNVAKDEVVVVNAIPKPSLLFVGIKRLKSGFNAMGDVSDKVVELLKKIEFYNTSSNPDYVSSINELLKGNGSVIGKIKNDYGQSLVVFGIEKRIRLRRYIDFYVFNTDFFKLEKITIEPSKPGELKKLADFIGKMPVIIENTCDITVIKDPMSNTPVVISSYNDKLKPGDLIVSVNGLNVITEKDVYNALKVPESEFKIQRGKDTLSVSVKTVKRPVQIRQNINSLSYNSAYLYFLTKINDVETDDVEKSAAKLNLGVCYLRFGMFENAYDTFSSANLPDTPGVSAGTIVFLKGICYQEIGLWSDLQMLFDGYAKNPNATVINSHGFKVKDLIDFTHAYLKSH